MKKARLYIPLCAALLLTGCAAGKSEAGRAFEEVILRGGEYISPATAETGTLSELYNEGTEHEMPEENRKFALFDLDGDGTSEVILSHTMGSKDYDDGYLILRYSDGQVYGYYKWYRAFYDLKTDGSYHASGGSTNWGVYTVSAFTSEGIESEALFRCEDLHDGGGVTYYVNGELSTLESFTQANSERDELENVPFRSLSEFDGSLI